MCAIFGILGDYHPAQAREALTKMTHRGPDHCGIIERDRLFFSHNRLSILDTSSRAHQPMTHGEILLSFNGEIYNHTQLREELDAKTDGKEKGYPFSTSSDSEVLIAAYLRWGIDFVDHLVGMFAIALLDGDTLYLIRDRLGKKPLFFYQEGARFIFASEIKGIRVFLPKVTMNEEAMISYLSFLAPTPPHTFYQGIERLAAGEILTFRHGKQSRRHYYSPLDVNPSLITSETEAIRRIEEHLAQAIHLRLNADVPMATLLSGGIDSALIAAFTKASGRELTTFTLGYDEYANYDERANAKATADALGLRNIAVEITQKQFMDASEAVFDSIDEPLNDPAAVPLYLLFQEIAKEGYKVVLSGEGSDELFLGYRQYFEYLDIEKAASLHHKNWLKKYFRANFSMNREWEWYKRVFDETLLFRSSGEKFTDLQKNALLRRNIKDNDSLRYLQPYREAFEQSDHTDESIWYTYIDLQLFQAEHFLSKLDRVSMAHSIEARTPFLDHRLVETLFSIEPRLRYEKGVTKALLKAVASTYLPQTVITRKKKGFSNPYMEWLTSSGKLSLIGEVNAQTGLFKKDVLERYLQTARKGRFKQHVWGLYVLSHWIDKELL